MSDAEDHGPTIGPLRQQAAAATGRGMKDLTVLATQNDPFRVDTAAGHRDGAWLAITGSSSGMMGSG